MYLMNKQCILVSLDLPPLKFNSEFTAEKWPLNRIGKDRLRLAFPSIFQGTTRCYSFSNNHGSVKTKLAWKMTLVYFWDHFPLLYDYGRKGPNFGRAPSLKLKFPPLKIHPWKRRFLLEAIIFGCYVSFRECIVSCLLMGHSFPQATYLQLYQFDDGRGHLRVKRTGWLVDHWLGWTTRDLLHLFENEQL